MNDKDAFLCNVWRALQSAPEETAQYADWPANEADLSARHLWLRDQREGLTARLMGDPGYYDATIAGWWLWGISLWIGGGWCGKGGEGPWGVVDGRLAHLGNAGRGVKRQRVHLGGAGEGVSAAGATLLPWFQALQERLRRVRVCCGDWQRVLGPSVTYKHGLTGILLDPPYSTEENRHDDIYAEDSGTVAHDVRAWCLREGHHRLLRIILCGYGDVHDELLNHGWTRQEWTGPAGYSNIRKDGVNGNRHREVLWCSPACLGPEQPRLF